MQHIKHLLEQEIETLATPTNTVISASTRAAIEFDFGFETLGEKKLCEMLSAAKDYIREMGSARLRDGFPSWDGAARERPTLPVVSPVSSRPMLQSIPIRKQGLAWADAADSSDGVR